MSWNDWMESIFSPAAPPPPVPPAVVVQPSPVPGCDASTWAAYEALMALREGVEYKVYYDSLGKPTGGIGHLLLPSDGLVVGQAIPAGTVQRWFTHDGATAMDAAVTHCRQAGITQNSFLAYQASVCYQLGIGWTTNFPKTWAMICKGQYAQASAALVTTQWNKQTPVRVADFQKGLLALPPKA